MISLLALRNLLDPIVDEQLGNVPAQSGICGLHENEHFGIDP